MKMHCGMFCSLAHDAERCFVVLTTLVWIQYRTLIQGVVTDTTGRSEPGANSRSRIRKTGQKQVRVSDDAVCLTLMHWPAARFRFWKWKKTGFQKQVLDNVNLIPEQAKCSQRRTRDRI